MLAGSEDSHNDMEILLSHEAHNLGTVDLFPKQPHRFVVRIKKGRKNHVLNFKFFEGRVELKCPSQTNSEA